MTGEEAQWLLTQLAELRARVLTLEKDTIDVTTVELETWDEWRQSAPGVFKQAIEDMIASGPLRTLAGAKP
jgi:hypothetical protein